MISVLVCDPNPDCAKRIARVLSDTDARVLFLSGLPEAVKCIRDGKAEVLVVGPSISLDDAMASIDSIRDAGSNACIVLHPQQVTQELLHAAIRAGVDDVVPAGASDEEVADSLKAIVEKAIRRAGSPEEAAATASAGQVVTVLSMKGGVGKTVVSTNLAVALAGLGNSVALVDLDLQFGDVGIMLGLEPKQTIVGAVQSGERLDAQMLDGFLLPHSSGVKVLLAPTQPEDAEIVTASRIDRIIGLLITMFDYVVVDTPPSLDEAVLTALDRSDRIVVVTMMDVASVKNSRVSLRKLQLLGYDGSAVDIMLNRADSKVFLRVEEVEQAVGRRIDYRLPSDLQIPRSVNKGVPVVLDAPRSQPAKVIIETARSIVAQREEVHSDVA